MISWLPCHRETCPLVLLLRTVSRGVWCLLPLVLGWLVVQVLMLVCDRLSWILDPAGLASCFCDSHLPRPVTPSMSMFLYVCVSCVCSLCVLVGCAVRRCVPLGCSRGGNPLRRKVTQCASVVRSRIGGPRIGLLVSGVPEPVRLCFYVCESLCDGASHESPSP